MQRQIIQNVVQNQQITKKMITVLIAGASSLAIAFASQLSVGASSHCIPISTSKGPLTAAQVGGNVSGEVDATGCDIGAYFNNDNPGKVKNAEIHDANKYGVYVDGNVAGATKVDITNSSVYNIGNHNSSGDFDPSGDQTGLGIYYAGFDLPGTVSGSISGNEISEYQKGGVAINGSNASANVKNNSVTGLSPVAFIAQNGIQFGYGAVGQVSGNTVNGNSYSGTGWTSSGILLFEADNVKVTKNTVENNQTAIAIESWCWFVQSASNNKVIGNTISGAQYGITVVAYSIGGASTCDAQANNNKVTNNSIESDDGDLGVFVGIGEFGSDSPEADNNKVIHNDVSGFTTPYGSSDDTATKVHANAF